MRTSPIISGLFAASTVAAAAISNVGALRSCLFPEPEKRICYSESGATPQNLDMREVQFTADYLRAYQEQQLAQGKSPFWLMPFPDAGDCAEWQVTTKGRTWIMAKLVGEDPAGLLFSDIANTIDGLNLEDAGQALTNCSTAGGQMGAIVDEEDPLYRTQLFKGFTNKGIVIKVVKSPM